MTADLARTEWELACDAFRDAQLLLSNGGFDGAASRAYYADHCGVLAIAASAKAGPPATDSP